MMNSVYPMQVGLIWFFLIAFYYLFLGNNTFFRLNRYYLLVGLLLGLVVPFLQSYLVQSQVGVEPIVLPTITITNQIDTEYSPEIISSVNWISIIYWIGLVLMSLRFLKGSIGIVWLTNSSQKEKSEAFTIVHLEKEMSPFSFFNYIFIYQKADLSKEEWEQIYIHESTHSKQLHSIDILFTEVLMIVFWWNPLIYIYQKALQEVHEYEADNAVKNIKNTKQYGLLLMKQSFSGNHAALSNGFINSQLKKRIIMMTKKRSSKLAKIRYFWSLPLLVLLALVTFGEEIHAQTSIEKELNTAEKKLVIAQTIIDTIFTFNPETFEETVDFQENYIYKNEHIEQIAVLKGCETLSSEKDQRDCSNQKLLQSIFDNVQYPEEALDAKIEGMVIVKINIFPEYRTIENNYKWKNKTRVSYQIVQDPGYGMGPEVIRALWASNLNWMPAMNEGKELDVQLILPVKFKLNLDSKSKDKETITKNEIEKGFNDVKMSYTNSGLDISFNSKHDVTIQVFDMMGHTLVAEKYDGPFHTDYVDGNQIIFIVLQDNNGTRIARKLSKK